MSNLLVHIADRVLNRPLMILPEKLALISSVLEGRIGIDASELKDIEAADQLKNGPDSSRFVGNFELADPLNPTGDKKPYRTSKGVALIPVLGSLVNRGAWIGSRSGMTSYEGVKYQIAAAAADASVSSILLDMDSPGGEAVGAFEVADVVAEAGKSKPVVALINGMSASAAYAIASAATQIITTSSGVSGSIGVVLLHADYSHALHERGVKPTLIHAGARKVDGNPYQPLTDDVKAELKAEVDQFYDLFVSGVVKGRKGRMSEKAVRGTEARTFIGQAAVDVGLADAVGSFEAVLADLTKRGTVRTNPTRTKMDKTFTQAEFDAAVATARVEATAALKAETEKALAAATEAGKIEGAKAERERVKGILASDEAKERPKGALHLAITTDLTVDGTKAALSGVAKETAAGGTAASHGLFLSEQPSPQAGGDKADHGWGDIVAKVNKQFAPTR